MQITACGSRFARPEWERRFLLDRIPPEGLVACARPILDRYITGTTLRLRRVAEPDGSLSFKLTQKRNKKGVEAYQGQLTTIYLAEEEYNVLRTLPASVIEKTRYSVPPFGVDLFRGNLSGLILAEAEFTSAEEAAALQVPAFLLAEVTHESRFTGGCLSVSTREQLADDLLEFGIMLDAK